MRSLRHRGWVVLVAAALLAGSEAAVWADGESAQQIGMPTHAMCDSSRMPAADEFEGVQIETGDIKLHERFFLEVLHAEELQRIDHPQVDHIRGYCYRHLLIVVRQDIKTPRPTGWVQVNFSVADVGAVQEQIERALRRSEVAKLDDAERAKIVRLRFKPDVPRNNCRVARLEVNGPDGFMMGFDQFKEGSCKAEDIQQPPKHGESDRPHH